VEDWDLGFHAGSALKYIARYRYKGTPVLDLRKAAQFLTRLADKMEAAEQQPEPLLDTTARMLQAAGVAT
jgi:ribosomal protein S2